LSVLTAIGRYAAPLITVLFLQKTSKYTYPLRSFAWLTVLQLLFAVSYALGQPGEIAFSIALGFGGLTLAGVLLLLSGSLHRSALLALFLCTLGMCVLSSVCPEEAPKQIFAIFLGIGLYFLLFRAFREQKWRKVAANVCIFGGLWLLVVTLLFGREQNGARSWLYLGNCSLQPSEPAKLSLIFAGYHLRKNRAFFWYGIACCLCLGLSKDFGTALIYFAVFCALLFCRSHRLGAGVLLSGALLGSAAVRCVPRIKGRFAAWGHIWENPMGSGYQQTKALGGLAAGGFLGLGANGGQLPKIFSAASDLAVAALGEQWGLFSVITAVAALLAIVGGGKKSMLAVGAGALFLSQGALNFFGMVDFLPFTGVPFPFLSNGGSAMVCAWGTLAFLEAEDEN
jgi:cell division protein FtsW (lipid II flippase)